MTQSKLAYSGYKLIDYISEYSLVFIGVLLLFQFKGNLTLGQEPFTDTDTDKLGSIFFWTHLDFDMGLHRSCKQQLT